MSVLKWLVDRCLLPPLAALQFLTLTPPIVRRPFTPQELGRAVGFFPLVGALVGLVLAGIDWLLAPHLPVHLTAAVLLALWVIAIGALHIDGFLDSLDGIFGGYTPEMRLEIMHDERVGAFGMAGGVMLLILKSAALIDLPDRGGALVIAPTLARWGISLGVTLFPYARTEGLGRAMKDQTNWRQVALATVTALVVAWLTAGYLGLAALVLVGCLTWLLAHFVTSRIPGLTGDIYGAVGETLELALLLLFATMGSR